MYEKLVESLEQIQTKVKLKAKLALILGSGLGDLVDLIEEKEIIEYKDIKNFPVSTVKGHKGSLVFGKLNGVEIMAMQGRFHFYEGYTMKEVTYPIYLMKLFGIEKLIVSNAAGGINKNFQPGDLMLINDFINLFGTNPLIGINDERFGERFPDMSEAYKKDLMNETKDIAKDLKIDLKEGVYAGCTGPYYETAAEIRYMSKIGADAVGMSTVPETIVANYLGIDVLGISCITNMATGIKKDKHSHEAVVEIANLASKNFCNLVGKIVEKLKN